MGSPGHPTSAVVVSFQHCMPTLCCFQSQSACGPGPASVTQASKHAADSGTILLFGQLPPPRPVTLDQSSPCQASAGDAGSQVGTTCPALCRVLVALCCPASPAFTFTPASQQHNQEVVDVRACLRPTSTTATTNSSGAWPAVRPAVQPAACRATCAALLLLLLACWHRLSCSASPAFTFTPASNQHTHRKGEWKGVLGPNQPSRQQQCWPATCRAACAALLLLLPACWHRLSCFASPSLTFAHVSSQHNQWSCEWKGVLGPINQSAKRAAAEQPAEQLAPHCCCCTRVASCTLHSIMPPPF